MLLCKQITKHEKLFIASKCPRQLRSIPSGILAWHAALAFRFPSRTSIFPGMLSSWRLSTLESPKHQARSKQEPSPPEHPDFVLLCLSCQAKVVHATHKFQRSFQLKVRGAVRSRLHALHYFVKFKQITVSRRTLLQSVSFVSYCLKTWASGTRDQSVKCDKCKRMCHAQLFSYCQNIVKKLSLFVQMQFWNKVTHGICKYSRLESTTFGLNTSMCGLCQLTHLLLLQVVLLWWTQVVDQSKITCNKSRWVSWHSKLKVWILSKWAPLVKLWKELLWNTFYFTSPEERLFNIYIPSFWNQWHGNCNNFKITVTWLLLYEVFFKPMR